MWLAEIRRYPVKSLLGERLDSVPVQPRGLAGDRYWAVRDPDGKLGSGKSTRRFRKMDGLLDLRAELVAGAPVIEFPDGRRLPVTQPQCERALSAALGRTVTVGTESAVDHHDDGPVSIITTAALRRLTDLVGDLVEPARFRANLLVDAPGTGFPEDAWLQQPLRVGEHVVLRPQALLTRCVMIGMAQQDLPDDGRLLHTLGRHHDLTFGVWATVERTGVIRVGDQVSLAPGALGGADAAAS